MADTNTPALPRYFFERQGRLKRDAKTGHYNDYRFPIYDRQRGDTVLAWAEEFTDAVLIVDALNRAGA